MPEPEKAKYDPSAPLTIAELLEMKRIYKDDRHILPWVEEALKRRLAAPITGKG